MPQFAMVSWQQSDGREITTRVYTCELDAFISDVNSVSGHVLDMHGVGN